MKNKVTSLNIIDNSISQISDRYLSWTMILNFTRCYTYENEWFFLNWKSWRSCRHFSHFLFSFPTFSDFLQVLVIMLPALQVLFRLSHAIDAIVDAQYDFGTISERMWVIRFSSNLNQLYPFRLWQSWMNMFNTLFR